MPFSIDPPANAAPAASTLRVDPDKIVQLKADLEPIREEVEKFLQTRAYELQVRPLGADPVSRDAADTFNQNADAAIATVDAYVNEMNNVINALDRTAKDYHLVDDTHAQTFRRGNP